LNSLLLPFPKSHAPYSFAAEVFTRKPVIQNH
jgi:hypothetical protein